MKKLLYFIIGSCCIASTIADAAAQTINITGPVGSGQFGTTVTVLTNGNYVVTDRFYDEGAVADVGAVYLYNGSTHALISTLKGTTASDQIGSGGITALTNGNYVVISPAWDNGAATNAGPRYAVLAGRIGRQVSDSRTLRTRSRARSRDRGRPAAGP